MTSLVDQGKRAIGPVGLQLAILKHLIQANAFPAAASADFTTQPFFIEGLARFQAHRESIANIIARRKRRHKQNLYQASKDYKRLHDDWQGRSLRSYGRRKSRTRGQDEAPHFKFSGGDVVRSEKEYLETLQSLASADNVSQGVINRCTSADIPAMAPTAPRPMNNSNGLILDPKVHFFRGANSDHWTEHEEALFIEAYLQFPKQFGKIAEAVPDKTPSQCVLFYYRAKKSIDLKVQLKKRKAQAQKPRRRSNTFGRKTRGREKSKQTLPSPEHKTKRARKNDHAAPSPAPSCSSNEQVDVVGDKDVSKSDYLADDSLVEPSVQDIEEAPAEQASPAAPVLLPCDSPVKVEPAQEEVVNPHPCPDAPVVKSIAKINALLNSPTDTPVSKRNDTAYAVWFGNEDRSAPPQMIVPALEAPVFHVESLARHKPVLEMNPYRPQRMPPRVEPLRQASYRHATSYHSSRQPTTPSWSSTQPSSFYSHPFHSSQPLPRMNPSMTSQRARVFGNSTYHGSTESQRQSYPHSTYQHTSYSYREPAPILQPHLHQPILSLRPPAEPSRLRPHSLNGPRSYPQNPDPTSSLGGRFYPRHI